MTSDQTRGRDSHLDSGQVCHTIVADLESLLEQYDYDFDRVPSQLLQQGPTWYAIFNPDVLRQIDLQVVKEFEQQSCFNIMDISFSPDARFLASRNGGAAQLWDGQRDWQKIRDFPDSPESHNVWAEVFQPVCFSPDSKLVATGGEEGHILVWDIDNCSCKHKIPAHNGGVRALAFSNDGKLLASGGGDNVVCLWDADSGDLTDELPVDGMVFNATWSPNGKLLAASSGRSIVVWDASTKLALHTFGVLAHSHSDLIASLVFSPCGKKLISGGFDNMIKIWSLDEAIPDTQALSMQLKGQHGIICSLAVTPDGKWLISGSKARNLMFWDLQSGNSQVLLQAFRNSVTGIDVSTRGYLIATSCADGRIRLFSFRELQHALG